MAEDRPKPGSLRDRIAAFESQNKNKTDSAPPPPRPKPGHFTREWKPTQINNESTDEKEKQQEQSGAGAGGMSTNDAKESIQTGGFGSLKERMAALKGKGAFGGAGFGGSAAPPGPAPAPKPTLKPTPPKKVSSSTSIGEESNDSPPVQEGESTEKIGGDDSAPEVPEATAQPAGEESREATEDDEQARRAAIAARMARLGGTRIGMAPPVFGRKPAPPVPTKKPSVDVQEAISKGDTTDEAGVRTPPTVMPTPADEKSEDDMKEKTEENIASPKDIPLPTSPPTVSPPPGLLVGPKRAAPPRKKRPTPTSTSVPATEKEEGTPSEQAAKPEEIALPPSRSTTLDVGNSVVSLVESPSTAQPSVEVEAEKTETAPSFVQEPFGIPIKSLGHMRLQSVATESIAETEEAATPPPRSMTPSEDEEGLPLDLPGRDPVEDLQVPAVDAAPTPELETHKTSKVAADVPIGINETHSQVASTVHDHDLMEEVQAISNHENDDEDENQTQLRGKEKETKTETEGMS